MFKVTKEFYLVKDKIEITSIVFEKFGWTIGLKYTDSQISYELYLPHFYYRKSKTSQHYSPVYSSNVIELLNWFRSHRTGSNHIEAYMDEVIRRMYKSFDDTKGPAHVPGWKALSCTKTK